MPRNKLLVRVLLLTLLLRAIPALTDDFAPREAASALGLGCDGHARGPLCLVEGSAEKRVGRSALPMRVLSVVADASHVVAVFGIAGAAGWGESAALLVALFAALLPVGITIGARYGLAAFVGAAGAWALLAARRALERGMPGWAALAGLLLGVATLLHPAALAVLLAVLVIYAHPVVDPRVRLVGSASGALAAVLAVFGRFALLPDLLSTAGPVDLVRADLIWGPDLPDSAAVAELVVSSLWGAGPAGPLSPSARWSDQFSLGPAAWAGLLVWVFVAWGLLRGRVTPASPAASLGVAPAALEISPVDPDEADGDAPASRCAGPALAARFQIFAPGPAHARPRRVGPRDYLPALLLVALPLTWSAAELGLRGATDLDPALALARAGMALLLGLGIAGLAGRYEGRGRTALLGLTTFVVIFCAAHLFGASRSTGRVVASRVASGMLNSAAGSQALLALGPRAPSVVWAFRELRRDVAWRIAANSPISLINELDALLAAEPTQLVVVLSEVPPDHDMELLDETLTKRGYAFVDRGTGPMLEDARLAVLRWGRGH